MNELLKKWREMAVPVKIRASVTLPFGDCQITDHDQIGVTVVSDGKYFCVPFSAITTIERV